jgi:hypothetical protein
VARQKEVGGRKGGRRSRFQCIPARRRQLLLLRRACTIGALMGGREVHGQALWHVADLLNVDGDLPVPVGKDGNVFLGRDDSLSLAGASSTRIMRRFCVCLAT